MGGIRYLKSRSVPVASIPDPAQAVSRDAQIHDGTVTKDPADRAHASALLAVVIWALVPVATRYFVQRVDPNVFNAIRFIAAGAAALPLCARVRPWRWCRKDQLLLLACGALSVPGYNMPVALGARSVPAGEIGVLIATESLMIAALTMLIRRRAVPMAVIGGSFIALAGVALTSGLLTARQNFHGVGVLEILAGALSWSLYTVIAGPLNQRYGSLGVTGAILVVGSLVLLALSVPAIEPGMLPDRVTLALLAALGVASSLVGFLCWNYAGAVLPPERLGLYLYMIPLVSICGGAGLLAESITVTMLFGAVLVVGGVWIASGRRRPLVAALTE